MSLRFTVLRHTMPPGQDRSGVHWDLLFELPDPNALLLTFAFPTPPGDVDPETVQRLPDHRRLYLDYEGEISRGRGTVEQWDGGFYEGGWLSDGKCWRATLAGDRISISLKLTHQSEDCWQAASS